jgi:hypothetical protein
MTSHHASAVRAAPPARDVIDRAARRIAVPKAAPATSFVLHAPLELAARVGLLAHLPVGRSADALDRIEDLAGRYEAAGDPVAGPPAREGDPRDLAARLLAAVRAGDLDEVDALAAALLPSLPPAEAVRHLADATVTSLAAAGHAPIGFFLLDLVAPALPATLLRGALRGLASRPDWQVRWHLGEVADGDVAGLHRSLAATPRLGRPGSDFIFPLMSQVQDSGVAGGLLGHHLTDRYDPAAVTAVLTRVAAWSMIHDDPSQAPYGWSHTMTMPQAVMALAGRGVRPLTALAVAGTYTVGFRAAHGTVELPDRIEPGADPDVSAADLALAASLHEDAHLVKHTYACLVAAETDPAYRHLYLRSASTLVEWWARSGT